MQTLPHLAVKADDYLRLVIQVTQDGIALAQRALDYTGHAKLFRHGEPVTYGFFSSDEDFAVAFERDASTGKWALETAFTHYDLSDFEPLDIASLLLELAAGDWQPAEPEETKD